MCLPSTSSEVRARIFISCGQRKEGSDERRIAQLIKVLLEAKGFNAYVATEVHSPGGLWESIFNVLSSSEYFLFIDFKREELKDPSLQEPNVHRGSLFSHQELAVACYLQIPILAYQEEGVKPNDGILQYVQVNPKPFRDREMLPDSVIGAVDREGWNPNWRNQLVMERNPNEYSEANITLQQQDGQRTPVPSRFFHIDVRNLNIHKHARNCYAFLERIRNLSTGQCDETNYVELKWAGYRLPGATILPGSQRRIDAFFAFNQSPRFLQSSSFTDATDYVPRVEGPGDYDLTYVVVSDNFQRVTSTFRVHLGDKLDEISLVQVE